MAEHSPVLAHHFSDVRQQRHAAELGMWLFLATEVMFFTGLIGSYIVLRAGSPPTAFSNLYSPGTVITDTMLESKGVLITSAAPDAARGGAASFRLGWLARIARPAAVAFHQ